MERSDGRLQGLLEEDVSVEPENYRMGVRRRQMLQLHFERIESP